MEYYEEVPLHQWASIMMGIFIVALTPTFILEYFAVTREPFLLWFYLFMDLFFIVLLFNFRKMTIRIGSGMLVASFGLIKKRIKLGGIQKCQSINASLGVYTGMGIRVGGDGSLAYLPKLGEAVKLEFVSGRPFVFSTNNSEKVLEILNQYCKDSSID